MYNLVTSQNYLFLFNVHTNFNSFAYGIKLISLTLWNVCFWKCKYEYVFVRLVIKPCWKGGGADVPLFETIKTNAGTQPKNELQQWALVWQLHFWCLLRNCKETAEKPPLPPKTTICRRIFLLPFLAELQKAEMYKYRNVIFLTPN